MWEVCAWVELAFDPLSERKGTHGMPIFREVAAGLLLPIVRPGEMASMRANGFRPLPAMPLLRLAMRASARSADRMVSEIWLAKPEMAPQEFQRIGTVPDGAEERRTQRVIARKLRTKKMGDTAARPFRSGMINTLTY